MSKAAKKKAAPKAAKASKDSRKLRTDKDYFPREGTTGHAIWTAANKISSKTRKPAAYQDVLKALPKGTSAASVRSGYSRWRKHYGVEGRVTASA